jgi:hypothetical protein
MLLPPWLNSGGLGVSTAGRGGELLRQFSRCQNRGMVGFASISSRQLLSFAGSSSRAHPRIVASRAGSRTRTYP